MKNAAKLLLAPSGYRYANAEAAALVDRFTTPPTNTRKVLIDTLVGSLKSGGIWSKLDAFYVFAAADAQAGQQNWIQDLYNATAVASPTFTADRGYATDGAASYLNTGLVLSASTLFTQNSAHFGLWSRSSGTGSIDIGARVSGAVDQSVMLVRTAGNAFNARINAIGVPADISTSITDGTGHFVGVRPDSSTLGGYRNGSSVGSISSGSDARPALAAFIGALNQAGAATAFTARQYASAHIGASLTAGEVASLYAALNTYLVAVGAA